MLIFPLKKQWYDKIKSGEKTVEYREVKAYWRERLRNAGCLPNGEAYEHGKVKNYNQKSNVQCVLQLGYNPKERIYTVVKKVEIVDGKNTDLKIDKPVYAIHFELEE